MKSRKSLKSLRHSARMRVLALPLAVLTALPLAGCTTEGSRGSARQHADADPAARPELQRFYRQKLTWRECGDVECARLTVPRDYAHPGDGKTFVLPVARAATDDEERRVGTLVYNPGGPGESGVADLKDGGAESFGAKARAGFDIVSFDPRGVAGSRPALDCPEEEDEQEDAAEEQPPVPRTAAARAQALADARAEATACRKGSRGLLRHVGTQDVARDLDVLRAALGERKLTYVGWSYGTHLGTRYAEQFPRRVRAMVLDGAVDPSLGWAQRALSEGTGFRRAVDDYAKRCAEVVGSGCPGESPGEIRRLIEDLYERTEHEPLPVDGEEEGLGTTDVVDAVSLAMYAPEDDWKPLSAALRAGARGDGTKLAELSEAEEPGPAARLRGKGERGERESDGAVDNSDAAILAVSCADTAYPRTAEPYWDALERAEGKAGLYGVSSVLSVLACKDLPSGTQRPRRVAADGVPPVLVVGTTGDPATPYEEAESVAEQFPGGMLLTYEAPGHTAYGRAGACVTKRVDDYLVGLREVPDGTTC
ncbi:alpha/beta hydrolase [Streptomyces spectabilis]|uniref:Pimeloyl-ACP methyl ester carboxylesterase n=2 Tax=Streptomyces spectabilis TaxID=68270 RepID=A0A7W8ER71_STRST|nr:alpha/beta hydrolase [Streptomyces spectabilis]MBB5101096.1 pimeloyl-ACP methyl ester carboxylesterase [Streptomyces spectabilis]MCI3900305.1 alpha/beta hydrolase [Streptomyces spectabilis]